ncbi:MAG: XTP/dITP diphosphatase [Chloroflexi bacterium]|nr:XTP/dITP diphosphatase [Chloroflexota bacterium]
MKLLIATRNPGKKAEYAAILADFGLELVTLADLGIEADVDETGSTFAENALLKARAYAGLSGLLTLADDSGLEVDALDGAPGIRSARYAGPGATDQERYQQLLRALDGVPDERRGARFRCAIALVWPDGREEIVEGTCEGRITHEPRGTHGFGYDPVFHVLGYGCTMAELSPETKNRISHRARAGALAREVLRRDLDRPLARRF